MTKKLTNEEKDDLRFHKTRDHIIKMRFLSDNLNKVIKLLDSESRAGYVKPMNKLTHGEKRSLIQACLNNQCSNITTGENIESMWKKCQVPLVDWYGWTLRKTAKKIKS